jgi:hypothetical protein
MSSAPHCLFYHSPRVFFWAPMSWDNRKESRSMLNCVRPRSVS